MHEACDEIARQNGGRFAFSLAGSSVPPALVDVADAFCQLQQARHEADYDVGRAFMRREVNDLIDLTSKAFSDWRSIRNSLPADVFLTALLAKRGMCR
jgi:hypothetical protein